MQWNCQAELSEQGEAPPPPISATANYGLRYNGTPTDYSTVLHYCDYSTVHDEIYGRCKTWD